jgi:hypothetical protein
MMVADKRAANKAAKIARFLNFPPPKLFLLLLKKGEG